jgi:hypothetical protein
VLLAGGFVLLFPEPQAASPSTKTNASTIAKVFFIVTFPFTLDSGHGETSHSIPYIESLR